MYITLIKGSGFAQGLYVLIRSTEGDVGGRDKANGMPPQDIMIVLAVNSNDNVIIFFVSQTHIQTATHTHMQCRPSKNLRFGERTQLTIALAKAS